MKRLNNKGFGLIELLLLLIFILLLIFFGWYIWKQNQSKQSSESQDSAQQAPSQQDEEADQEETNYLEIPELGIKMKLDDDTADAYYYMNSGYAYLSLESLKETDDCAADETSIAAVAKVKKTDVNEMTGKTYEEEAKAGYGTIIGDNVYVVSQAQAFCTEKPDEQKLANAARTAFPKLTIEAL